MTTPVTDAAYWHDRMYDALARGELHRLMFAGTVDELRPFDDRMQAALKVIGRGDSVLDVGCGYGRALGLMPRGWRGEYMGVDISPDLIEVAKRIHPDREFAVTDAVRQLKSLFADGLTWDWVLFGWMRTMLVSNGREPLWDEMHGLANRVIAARGVIVVD